MYPAARRSALLALPALALTLSACNSGSFTGSGARVVHGTAHGGQQPISAATIQLYAVNTTTTGGASTPLLTSVVTTSDGTGAMNANANANNNFNTMPAGSFNIPALNCPAGDALVYVSASGGNPGLAQGTNNPQIELLAAFGSCFALRSNFTGIAINEATTVGAIAALYPYTTAYNAIGSTPAQAQALTSAFNTANEYVNPATGVAPGPALPAGDSASAPDVYVLANALAYCVSSSGGSAGDLTSCGRLFQAVRPPATNIPPTDTVLAMLDISNSPGHNVGTIFDLQSPQRPFEPADMSPPADYTLPIYSPPPAPAFSLAAGSYSSAQSVTITDADTSATIYYTLNGTTPTKSSNVYTSTLYVTADETLSANALDHSLTGATTSATYSGSLTPVTPTVSLASVSSAAGSTTPITIQATESSSTGALDGSTVTFGVTSPATGSFSPASCTIAGGSCSVSFIPTGTLAAGTYTGDLTAGFSAVQTYAAANASSTLTIKGAAFSSGATLTTLAAFTGTTGTTPGDTPEYGNLIQASDGDFYGTTRYGGTNNLGTVFKISGTTYTVLHSFSSSLYDGEQPLAGLVEGSDGKFYGTTLNGGASNLGSVYSISASGSFTLLHSFSIKPMDGEHPYAGLVQGTNGNFYGTTSLGGVNGAGTVFSVTSSGTFSQVYSFSTAATDGETPYSGLLQAADGNFYGTTYAGGANGLGTVYEISNISAYTGTFTLLHSFSSATTDGENPYAGLVQGTDGYLYGTTSAGGASTYGTVFKVQPAGSNFTLLHSFSVASTDGATPYGGLVQGSDGNLYGTTSAGGARDYGTVFQVQPAGSSLKLVNSSPSGAMGQDPLSGLVQGTDGAFYGTNSAGDDGGTVYKLASDISGAGPISVTVPSSVTHATSFTLGYAVSNAYSATLQNCFATNTAGDTTGWTGSYTGSPIVQNVTLTAPATAGSYTYSLTCGGQESGFATLNVQ